MNSECLRIADQLVRGFTGDAWHGDPLSKLLTGITAEQAVARPLTPGHNIWELVLHIELWARIALDATRGVAMPRLYGTERDWTQVTDGGAEAWSGATGDLLETGRRLAETVAEFGDARLHETVPGREYNFYHLFHGIVQHSLYHGGQIAMLKRAVQ